MAEDREPALAPGGKRYESDEITVWYDARRCRHVGECVRGDGAVFVVGRRPWIRPELASAAVVADVVSRCPTGALHYRLADGTDEPAERPTRVSFRPDGAIWVRGDLQLETPDGVVAERRAALCGCGRTGARPWCDAACLRPESPDPVA